MPYFVEIYRKTQLKRLSSCITEFMFTPIIFEKSMTAAIKMLPLKIFD